ncbi:MAG: hypothetical protein IT343_19140 [Candidatus Melainabacteria bacterium]|jgi:hypothetical protein|nr:hypothetical protein [Candidatus Melainabacteria bacterium]
MPLIDKKYLEQLRSAGLHVSHPIPAFCNGVWVCKPTATPGHNMPGFEGGYITLIGQGPGCPDIDAPMLAFFFHHDKWIVSGQDCAGGMGPADFVDEWESPEEAVKDILDFYFGDPSRMQKKVAEHEKIEARFREHVESTNGASNAQPD